MSTYYTHIDSPIDRLMLVSDGASLTGVYMLDQRYEPPVQEDWIAREDVAPFPEAIRQLRAYFEGTLTEFTVPLAPTGTPFQRRVWEELGRIPYGMTLSYGELAKRVGNGNASRAVGMANGRNPIPIIVPCHRVIGANGSLTGFGGGLPMKKWLLSHESGGHLF